MLEISPSRQESRLNPKAFVSEINEGVEGFKGILLEAIFLIEEHNKNAHKKLFSDKGKITIVNSPLKINVENFLADLRSGFDRGAMSIQSYQEILQLDPITEKERRKKELENGDEDLFYPHLIQNQEATPDRMGIPAKPKDNTKLEDQNKLKNTPETKNKTASLEDDLEMAPYTMENYPSYLKKYPKHAIEIWVTTFNEVLKKTGEESKAFPIAWNSLKRYMKKLKSEETK
jgi:hypothetical protein